jgi:hypothetical protein
MSTVVAEECGGHGDSDSVSYNHRVQIEVQLVTALLSDAGRLAHILFS